MQKRNFLFNKIITMEKLYVQYGCGASSPKGWSNYDASPTLRIQKLPILGFLLRSCLNVKFPSKVQYGDIVKGIRLEDGSCNGIYCSHILEHLSLEDFRIALKNTYKMLKKDGIFRCVIPDLEYSVREYIKSLESGDSTASIIFIQSTKLGRISRPRRVMELITTFMGNSPHLWMWDRSSLLYELKRAGFEKIRYCNFNDCEDMMFNLVEDSSRFEHAVAIECRK